MKAATRFRCVLRVALASSGGLWRSSRFTRMVLAGGALAVTPPVVYAVTVAQSPAPEAAPATADQQAVWNGWQRQLGTAAAQPLMVAQLPNATIPPASSSGAPVTSAAPAPAAPSSVPTAGAAPAPKAKPVPEVHDFYKDLMQQPVGLPPGVVARFDPAPGTAPRQVAANPAPAESGDVENTAVILNLALRYWGVPYRWGGANRGGVDCSGLIIRAAADGGKPGLPHSAAELWKIGTPIPKGQMKVGDLVFFKNTYKPGISHVGIYSGNGKFLEASSGKGKVTTSSLSAPYWVKHWAGARRWDFLAKKKPAPAERKA